MRKWTALAAAALVSASLVTLPGSASAAPLRDQAVSAAARPAVGRSVVPAADQWIGNLGRISDVKRLWRFLAAHKYDTVYVWATGRGEVSRADDGSLLAIWRVPQSGGYPWAEYLHFTGGPADPSYIARARNGRLTVKGYISPETSGAGAGYWMWNVVALSS